MYVSHLLPMTLPHVKQRTGMIMTRAVRVARAGGSGGVSRVWSRDGHAGGRGPPRLQSPTEIANAGPAA